MGSILHLLAPPNVSDWPLWARRAFVVSLPVSGPLWIAWLLAFVAGFGVFGAAVMIIALAAWAITPLAKAIFWGWETTSGLWASRQEGSTPADGALGRRDRSVHAEPLNPSETNHG